jgi:AdoMet-dependent heme synthase
MINLSQTKIIYKIFSHLPNFIKTPFVKEIYKKRMKNLNALETPKVLTFFITNRCNARCKHCFYWKELNSQKKQEMTLDQITSLVKSLKTPLFTASLTGGEPFLREDLTEICKIFERHNSTKKISIPTNGYLSKKIYKDVSKILKETNVELDVLISMDGLNETSAKIRGIKDIFEKAEETIKLLKRIKNKRFRLFVLTTVSKENYAEVLPLIKYNKKNWKIDHKVQYVRSCNEVFRLDKNLLSGFEQKNKEDTSIPSLGEIEQLNKNLSKAIKRDTLSIAINNLEREATLEILKSKNKVMNCVAGKFDGVVYPNGDVTFCEFIKPYGNLRETNYNFSKLWNSEKANKIRTKINGCACIHSCNLIDSISHDNKMLLRLFKK